MFGDPCRLKGRLGQSRGVLLIAMCILICETWSSWRRARHEPGDEPASRRLWKQNLRPRPAVGSGGPLEKDPYGLCVWFLLATLLRQTSQACATGLRRHAAVGSNQYGRLAGSLLLYESFTGASRKHAFPPTLSQAIWTVFLSRFNPTHDALCHPAAACRLFSCGAHLDTLSGLMKWRLFTIQHAHAVHIRRRR